MKLQYRTNSQLIVDQEQRLIQQLGTTLGCEQIFSYMLHIYTEYFMYVSLRLLTSIELTEGSGKV